MNQGKLDVAKQEMARVNTNILGTSELQWTQVSAPQTHIPGALTTYMSSL